MSKKKKTQEMPTVVADDHTYHADGYDSESATSTMIAQARVKVRTDGLVPPFHVGVPLNHL